MFSGTCYERGSTVNLKWFLTDGGSFAQNRREKANCYHDSRCIPFDRQWGLSSGSGFLVLQISFYLREILSSEIERASAKKTANLYRRTRVRRKKRRRKKKKEVRPRDGNVKYVRKSSWSIPEERRGQLDSFAQKCKNE